jgi:hypothetical protein
MKDYTSKFINDMNTPMRTLLEEQHTIGVLVPRRGERRLLEVYATAHYLPELRVLVLSLQWVEMPPLPRALQLACPGGVEEARISQDVGEAIRYALEAIRAFHEKATAWALTLRPDEKDPRVPTFLTQDQCAAWLRMGKPDLPCDRTEAKEGA